jgi:NitT/TauT family transport system permease protein
VSSPAGAPVELGSGAGVEAVPRDLGRLVGRRAADWLPAVLVLVLGVATWQALVRGLDVQRFLLPAPSAIAGTLWDNRSQLWHAGLYTFSEAFGGWVVGSL